jgi:hypothetical protein
MYVAAVIAGVTLTTPPLTLRVWDKKHPVPPIKGIEDKERLDAKQCNKDKIEDKERLDAKQCNKDK